VFFIALVDPSDAEAARAEVARVLGDDTSNAQIPAAKYSFAQLKSWQNLHRERRARGTGALRRLRRRARVGSIARWQPDTA
jgi:hypothetical protein